MTLPSISFGPLIPNLRMTRCTNLVTWLYLLWGRLMDYKEANKLADPLHLPCKPSASKAAQSRWYPFWYQQEHKAPETLLCNTKRTIISHYLVKTSLQGRPTKTERVLHRFIQGPISHLARRLRWKRIKPLDHRGTSRVFLSEGPVAKTTPHAHAH